MSWNKEKVEGNITKGSSVFVYVYSGRTISGTLVDITDELIIVAYTLKDEIHYSHILFEDVDIISKVVSVNTKIMLKKDGE